MLKLYKPKSLEIGDLYRRKKREAFIKGIDDGHINMIKIEPGTIVTFLEIVHQEEMCACYKVLTIKGEMGTYWFYYDSELICWEKLC